ncbi:hypothetical protein VZT92_023363 [Zoarces viviparus]|uniref:Uncharacterized protein n=1 Tax=Zoarces viviparus TaxID=48416 RepID=A0AAW1E717_ZOAVI
MLLLYATVAWVSFGGSSSDVTPEQKCYGSSVTLPFSYTPPLFNGQLYFTPAKGGYRKLLMDKGEAKHPRLKVQIGSVRFTDLTERDEGTFSISYNNDGRYDVVKLTIRDCANKVLHFYGETYSTTVPRKAEFLEFIPLHGVDQLKVLWNRTDPQTNTGGRGRFKRNVWEIRNLNGADMGHYNIREKDNTLLSRILLEVREFQRDYITKVNERLLILTPQSVTPWTVTFTPEGGKKKQSLMHEGGLFTDFDLGTFSRRMVAVHNGIQIDPVESTDSGTFEFRDQQGYLVQTVQVSVNPEELATFVYVGIAVGIVFAVIVCCCCVRKCCCKKSSSKRAESAPQTAATPAAYYRNTNPPVAPGYSAAPALGHSSHYSRNAVVSRERTTISLEPSRYNSINVDVNYPHPEVAPLGGQGVDPAPLLGSDCLSSEPGPRFELKGVHSAPPLSSGSTFCDVYTSDKLNFL